MEIYDATLGLMPAHLSSPGVGKMLCLLSNRQLDRIFMPSFKGRLPVCPLFKFFDRRISTETGNIIGICKMHRPFRLSVARLPLFELEQHFKSHVTVYLFGLKRN